MIHYFRFVTYKLPLSKKHTNKLITNGLGYVYITSKNPSLNWTLSTLPINSSESILGRTLSALYKNESDLHLLYNDEPSPDSEVPKNDKLGHTKGALFYGQSRGFWMIHSIPHFPPVKSYDYPHKAMVYGQNILCISLDAVNLNYAGEQMQYNQPNIYKSLIKPELVSKFPNITQLIQKRFVKTPPWHNRREINSLAGESFVSFAKSRQFSKELYSDWVAVELKSNLDVESWLHGPGKIDSDCSKTYTVQNVETISVASAEMKFRSERDHSKWAVSTGNEKWVCIGDINRAVSLLLIYCKITICQR